MSSFEVRYSGLFLFGRSMTAVFGGFGIISPLKLDPGFVAVPVVGALPMYCWRIPHILAKMEVSSTGQLSLGNSLHVHVVVNVDATLWQSTIAMAMAYYFS